jgi:hypothetical protein
MCDLFFFLVPVEAYGPTFNFSIWYLELYGQDDWHTVNTCMNWYNTVSRPASLIVRMFACRGVDKFFKTLA